MDDLYEELEFKRFPAEKQEQIRQLVAYTTLLGLTGKDLVSIGGKLDRMSSRKDILQNRACVESMEVRPIGKDTHIRNRWAHKHDDTTFHFSNADWYSVRIKNVKTGVSKTVPVAEYYNFGKWRLNGSFHAANIMLNIYRGDIKLDF